MNWRTIIALSALTLGACAGGSDEEALDSDDDGISDAEEEELGLDPNSSDSDGDGIDDGEELDKGLDPLLADSDDDGYDDFQEVDFGSDPLDDADVIYTGGWPYSVDKDELDPADVPTVAERGELFMNFTAVDQFGEEVQLWDMQNDDGKLTIIDVSAEWCGPCNVLSLWVDGGEDYYGLDPDYKVVREAIDEGEVRWVTILSQDNSGAPANAATIGRWFNEYPHAMIPVFPDNNYEAMDHVELVGFPTLLVLKDDMTVGWKAGALAGWPDALEYVKKRLD